MIDEKLLIDIWSRWVKHSGVSEGCFCAIRMVTLYLEWAGLHNWYFHTFLCR